MLLYSRTKDGDYRLGFRVSLAQCENLVDGGLTSFKVQSVLLRLASVAYTVCL